MSAGQDARAREIARKYSRGLLLGNELADAIAAALSEARDQGARDGDAIQGFVTDIRAATPSPALAPLREAVVTAAMAYWRTLYMPVAESDEAAATGFDTACAALSSAQGSTTEGRK